MYRIGVEEDQGRTAGPSAQAGDGKIFPGQVLRYSECIGTYNVLEFVKGLPMHANTGFRRRAALAVCLLAFGGLGKVSARAQEPLVNLLQNLQTADRVREAEKMVRRAFQDSVNRAPSEDELAHYRQLVMENDWSEKRICDTLKAGGNGQTIAHTVSVEEARKLVREAYRQVLSREPDASGLDEFVGRVRKDGWTAEKVMAALRQSAEARGTQATEIVKRVYRDVLGREPDASGLEAFRQRILRDGWTEEKLRRALMNSDEYRGKHR